MPHKTPLIPWLAVSLGVWLVASPLLALAQEYRPPRRGIPGRREGAGTRGTCVQSARSLMPLSPQDGFSITASSSPTLFWYVPATRTKIAEFTLLGAEDQELYRQTIELSGKAGVIGLTLPDRVGEMLLKPGQELRWQFSLVCNPKQPSMNPFVEGVIQRNPPDQTLVDRLNRATSPVDQATLYAEAGIWQEAIATLATHRCLTPKDPTLTTSWATLLKSVKLDAYVGDAIACPASQP